MTDEDLKAAHDRDKAYLPAEMSPQLVHNFFVSCMSRVVAVKWPWGGQIGQGLAASK